MLTLSEEEVQSAQEPSACVKGALWYFVYLVLGSVLRLFTAELLAGN